MLKSQRGFAPIIVALAVVVLLGIGYLLVSKNPGLVQNVTVPGSSSDNSLVGLSPKEVYLKFKSEEENVVTADDARRLYRKYFLPEGGENQLNRSDAEILQFFKNDIYSNLKVSEIKSVEVTRTIKSPPQEVNNGRENSVLLEVTTTRSGRDKSLPVLMVQENWNKGAWKIILEGPLLR